MTKHTMDDFGEMPARKLKLTEQRPYKMVLLNPFQKKWP